MKIKTHKTNYLLLIFFTATITISQSCKSKKVKQQRYITNYYQELRDTFPDAEVNLLMDSIKVIFPEHMLFDVGSYSIKETFLGRLEKLCKLSNKYIKTKMLITGHTDDTGEEKVNENLSKNRAEAVKTTMIKYSVASNRLHTWGMAARNPRLPNNTTEGRAKNRRVEFVVLYEQLKN